MILKNGKRIDGMGDSMPIGSVIEYNGTDIPDGWEILPEDAEENQEKIRYSESEKIVGTWFDGSPLYRKSYIVPNLGEAGVLNVPLNIDNLKEIINMYGSANNGSTFFTLPSYRGTSGYGIIIYADINNGFTIEKENDRTDYKAYLTIEYIKKIN